MQLLFLFQISKLPQYLVNGYFQLHEIKSGIFFLSQLTKLSKILNFQYIANILAETTICYNCLLFKLVAPRYSIGNQNLNAIPKITLNGFNILLEFTHFIFLNYLRGSFSKSLNRLRSSPLKLQSTTKKTENV